HCVMRLLVGDHDQAVVLLLAVQFLDRLPEIRPVVPLRRVNGIAQSETTTRRHFDEISGVVRRPQMSRFHTAAWSSSRGFAWQRKSTSRNLMGPPRSYLASWYSSNFGNAAASPFLT